MNIMCNINVVKLVRQNEITVLGDTRCSICYEQLTDAKCSQLTCKHIYHMQCICDWTFRCNSCPLCRCEVVKCTAECMNVEYDDFDAHLLINSNTVCDILEKYEVPDDILQYIIENCAPSKYDDIIDTVCQYQPLSDRFIVKNISILDVDVLNERIDENSLIISRHVIDLIQQM